MTEPIWLPERLIIAAHSEQLAKFGGPEGLRDAGMLASALGRPRNKWAYEKADLIGCAAAYAFGLARNHPFVDGNKRIAFMSITIFLELNGILFKPDKLEALVAIVDLAAGKINEDGLEAWIRDTLKKAE